MSINPDFTKVSVPDHPSCSYEEWKKNLEAKMGENYDALYDTTLERIPKEPLYTKDIYAKCNHLDFMSGIPPFLRGPYSTMYVLHCGGIQRVLPPQLGRWSKGPVHRLRPAHPPRL